MITINFDELLKQFHNFFEKKKQQVKEGAKKVTIAASTVVKNEIIESIKKEQAVASGDLLDSISTSGLVGSSELFEITVGSSSPYAKFVEEGVRAGGKKPPTAKIYDWMIQKGMQASERGAYAISKSIQEKGIPAKRPFEKGVKNAEAKLNPTIDIIMDESLKKD